MSLKLNVDSRLAPEFIRGQTLEFVMDLPESVPPGFFENTQLACEIRRLETSGMMGFIAQIEVSWDNPEKTRLRFFHEATDKWPLGPAELDVLFTREENGQTKRYRSLPVRFTIKDGITRGSVMTSTSGSVMTSTSTWRVDMLRYGPEVTSTASFKEGVEEALDNNNPGMAIFQVIVFHPYDGYAYDVKIVFDGQQLRQNGSSAPCFQLIGFEFDGNNNGGMSIRGECSVPGVDDNLLWSRESYVDFWITGTGNPNGPYKLLVRNAIDTQPIKVLFSHIPWQCY